MNIITANSKHQNSNVFEGKHKNQYFTYKTYLTDGFTTDKCSTESTLMAVSETECRISNANDQH
jgi:hypothetical protein